LEWGEHHQLWSEEQLTEIRQLVILANKHLPEYFHKRVLDCDVKRKKESEFLSRLAMALFGGAALIAPMLVMTLHQSKLTSLLTISLFVVAVPVVLAWWMEDATNKDIVGAAAAYAAVLVVFVGAGTNTTG
jgi:hypothetical protein